MLPSKIAVRNSHSAYSARLGWRLASAVALLALTLFPTRVFAQTGGISGTVSDAMTTTGLVGVGVQVLNISGSSASFVSSGTGGAYSVTGLTPGLYFVRTFVSSTLNYIDEAWNNIPCAPCTPTSTTPVTVSAGVTTSNINFALSPGGSISGTLTDAGTSAAISGAFVTIYSSTGVGFRSASTNASGVYTATGLPPGFYFVQAQSQLNYQGEVYNDFACAAPCTTAIITSSTPVNVTGTATTSGINLALSLGGGVSGTVTDAGTSAPVAIATVQLTHTSGTNRFVATNASGVYSITGLPPGVYYARTFASTNNYQDEAYNDIPCIPSCNVFSGTPIFVGAGTTTSGINFGLAAGGIISGTITDAVTSAALASVTVNVYNTSGLFVGSGFTNTSGVYSVAGLPSGSYFARTFISSVTPGYIDELYNNIPCPCTITAGNPIVVTAGAITANVNFGLSTTPPVGTGGITGTVTDATNGAVLPNVSVQILNPSGIFVTSTATNASGVYVVTGLAPGTYYAAAFPSAVLNYIQEAYSDVPCVPCFSTTITTSTPIGVVSGANTPNINFPLSPGAIIAGTVSDASTGFLRNGVTVTAYTNTGTTARSASSDAAGIHYVKGLPTGQYFARTGLNGAASVELYNNIPCPYSACSVTTGTALNLTAGAAQSGVNFSFLPIGSPDLAIDFGGAGIYLLSSGNKWTQLHTFNPVSMAKGDLDGNGRDDLIVNFGPGIGLYAWMNHTTWTFLHPFSPSQMVTGDLNNDGRDDLVVVFPGYGLFRYNNGSWSALHNLEPTKLAIGQLDGSAGKELIVNFTGFGVYVFANNAAWTQLHTLNVSVLLTADIDGNGRDDVILVFPGAGLWAYKNNATWQNLHPSTPIAVVGGHLDTSSQADLVVDFGPGVGLFSYRNNSTWTFLHGLSSQGILLADRDATATDEVLVNFGGAGLYQLGSNGVWAQVHPLSPEGLVAGQIH